MAKIIAPLANSSISKEVYNDCVEKLKAKNLAAFENLCKKYKVYNSNNQHLDEKFYEQKIEQMQKDLDNYVNENNNIQRDILKEYTEGTKQIINRYEELYQQLLKYKQTTETEIVQVPMNKNQLKNNLETFIDNVVETLKTEAENKYISTINDEILDKMEEVTYDIEKKVETEILINMSTNVIEDVIPQVLDKVNNDLCNFVSQYWRLSNGSIIEIQNDLKDYLNDFEKRATEGIYDWFKISINSSLIPKTLKAKHVTKIIKNVMTMYNNSILNRSNIILPRCLRFAYSYLDLYSYYDDNIVKKIDRNYKSIEFSYKKSKVTIVKDSKHEDEHEDEHEHEDEDDNNDDEDDEDNDDEDKDDEDDEDKDKDEKEEVEVVHTIDGFISTIPLNIYVLTKDVVDKYNQYFNTNLSETAVGKKLKDYLKKERKSIKGKRDYYYIRKSE